MKAIRMTAIIAIAMLAICIAPVMSDGADAADHITVRISNVTLDHYSGSVGHDAFVEEGVFVYEKGDDAVMKAYISNPQDTSVRPVRGLDQVEKDKEYEVYTIYGAPPEFMKSYTSEHCLDKMTYVFEVMENESLKVHVKSLITDTGAHKSFVYYYMVKGAMTATMACVEDGTLKIGYVEGRTCYLEDDGYSDLYTEVEMEIDHKMFTGSPAVYVGATVVIVLLVAALIAICGRKPKL